jgi:uncharacterized protein (TIGR00266 family)
MQHQILEKPDFSMVQVTFEQPGESIVCEAQAMVARDSAVQMKTSLQGGMMSALKRAALGGESLFQNTFTATAPGQRLYFAPAAEGDVAVVNMDGVTPIMLSSGAYLGAPPSVTLDTKWGGAKGFFSGAGMFLLRATGTGPLFFCTYGGIHAVDVGPAGYICDTSTIVAFTGGLSYNVTKLGGLGGLLFSGEGLVCQFQGQGRLWISTRSPRSLVGFLNPYRPVQQRGG